MTYSVRVVEVHKERHSDSHRRKLGFADFEEARDYARRRTRDSIERLRSEGLQGNDLRAAYLDRGTYCVVEGGAEHYHSVSELDEFFAAAATKQQRNWAPMDSDITPRWWLNRQRRGSL